MIKLGTLAIWNLLTKRKVIKGNDPTFAMLQEYAAEQFQDLCKQPMPEFGYKNT